MIMDSRQNEVSRFTQNKSFSSSSPVLWSSGKKEKKVPTHTVLQHVHINTHWRCYTEYATFLLVCCYRWHVQYNRPGWQTVQAARMYISLVRWNNINPDLGIKEVRYYSYSVGDKNNRSPHFNCCVQGQAPHILTSSLLLFLTPILKLHT